MNNCFRRDRTVLIFGRFWDKIGIELCDYKINFSNRNMSDKGFSFETSKKGEEDDIDFLFDADLVAENKEKYMKLWNEVLNLKIELENVENNLEKFNTGQANDKHNYIHFKKVVEELKEELSVLKEDKKKTAEDLAKIINDPRWKELQFLDTNWSPSAEYN